jgi:hypothetical protein
MVSGLRPVRAGQVRYYEDPQLQSRIVKPSRAAPNDRVPRSDEWSGHGPISPSAKLLSNLKSKGRDPNGGLRRGPELPQQGDLVIAAPLRRLFGWLKDKGVTAIITAERGNGQLTRFGIEEYVSDCVILLDNRVQHQVVTRWLRVIKYRGSAHGTNEYPFLIDDQALAFCRSRLSFKRSLNSPPIRNATMAGNAVNTFHTALI